MARQGTKGTYVGITACANQGVVLQTASQSQPVQISIDLYTVEMSSGCEGDTVSKRATRAHIFVFLTVMSYITLCVMRDA